MEDPEQIHQIAHEDNLPGGPNDIDHPHGKRPSDSMKRGDGSVEDAFQDEVPDDSTSADGRIIEAGEGGTAGGLDEAEMAIISPVTPEGREEG